tara:strand:+ start:410 stop:676 length:267 start_codon:yes stop_codon:yes gene_type:complete
MVCLTDKFPLVDLFTHVGEIADEILDDYPFSDVQRQFEIEDYDGRALYCFFYLDPFQLSMFLENTGLSNFKRFYELRENRTGNPASLD